ncbi:MAG: PEGA domain-containing protein [Deltaproteobacteria bacterium]
MILSLVGPLLLLASPAAAIEPPPPHRVLFAAPANGQGVPPALAAKAAELLEGELAAAGVELLPDAEVDKLRQGAVQAKLPDVAPAEAALERGKDLYLNLKFKEAAVELASARDAFAQAFPQTGDFAPLAASIAYLGASQLGLGDEAGARATFRELCRLRPSHELDAEVYPPQVVSAFERAKAEVAIGPHGALTLASAPPLAEIAIDGERRGETPLKIAGLPAGRHAVRLYREGFRPWWGMIEISARGSRSQIRLEPNRAGDELRALEQLVLSDGEPAVAVRHAAALALAAGVDAVGVVALVQTRAGYGFSAALIGRTGTRIAWTALDPDFLHGSDGARALARTLLAGLGPTFVDVGPVAGKPPPDFGARLLGYALAAPKAAPPVISTPIYARWWFWTGLAALAAGGVTAYEVTRAPKVIQEPNTTALSVQVQP